MCTQAKTVTKMTVMRALSIN